MPYPKRGKLGRPGSVRRRYPPFKTGEKPVVTDEAATAIGQTKAIIHATVDPKGAGEAQFKWWREGEEGSPHFGEVIKMSVLTPIELELTGLEPTTQYFFVVLATNEIGSTLGTVLSFITNSPPARSQIAITREYPPDKVAIRIKSPNGYSNRWAEDESKAENVLSDIELEDEMPGGDKSMGGILARDPQLKWQEMEAYADIYAYQPGVKKCWEGSLDKAPAVSGDQMSLAPAALGYQAELEDDRASAIGFISTDLSKLEDSSMQRHINLLEGQFSPSAAGVLSGFQDSGTTAAGILFDFRQVLNKVGGPKPGAEQIWNPEGALIGKVMYDFIGDATSPWLSNIGIDRDDLDLSHLARGEPNGTTALQQTISTSIGGKYLFIMDYYNAAITTEFQMTNRHWFVNIHVFGTHGLSVSGSWPNIGLKMKQMIEYLINELTTLEARPEDVDDDEFLINNAWYGSRGPTSEIVQDLTKYSYYDWFVRRGKRFHVKKPGTYGNFWKSYVRESELDELGLDSQALWDEIVVSYQDANGRTIYAGPPGSGCDIESELLTVTDPDSPGRRAGRKRRDLIQLKGVGTPATAIEVGKRFLEEANLLNHAGSATLTGYVLDHNGVMWPAACVKSGDWISFVDASDRSYRKIVNRKYVHNNRGSEIQIDAPPSGMEQLLERLQAEMISLGVS